jgi:hypothetical protein
MLTSRYERIGAEGGNIEQRVLVAARAREHRQERALTQRTKLIDRSRESRKL